MLTCHHRRVGRLKIAELLRLVLGTDLLAVYLPHLYPIDLFCVGFLDHLIVLFDLDFRVVAQLEEVSRPFVLSNTRVRIVVS